MRRKSGYASWATRFKKSRLLNASEESRGRPHCVFEVIDGVNSDQWIPQRPVVDVVGGGRCDLGTLNRSDPESERDAAVGLPCGDRAVTWTTLLETQHPSSSSLSDQIHLNRNAERGTDISLVAI